MEPGTDAAFVELHTYPAQPVAEGHDFDNFGNNEVADENAEAFCGPPPSGEFHNRKDFSEDGGWHLIVAARHFQATEDPPQNPDPIHVQVIKESPVLFVLADGEQDLPTENGGLAGQKLTNLTVNSDKNNEWTFGIAENSAWSITLDAYDFEGYRWDPGRNSNTTVVNRTVNLEFDGIEIGTEPIWVKISASKGRTGGVAPLSPYSGPYSDANALVFVSTIEELRNVGTPEFDKEVLNTLIHEFTHSFGLTHRCGLADITGIYSCGMNYARSASESQPILNFDGGFLSAPFDTALSENRMTNLCAQHIIAIRRAKGFGGKTYVPN